MNDYATMSPEPGRVEPSFKPIPVTVNESNDCLCEALEGMCRIYKLLFGQDIKLNEIPKCECLEQSIEALENRAGELVRSIRALVERLGA